ncbi:MAG: putative HTH-type transcriptional regulator [Candidatus Thorarchaeota archaeon AB_25]|nr:MAG: putative HTH-type transcriptional regulator [Candidatus Thorarchaeota archaeon AB_25]
MDSIDKRILLALDENCRLSYQALAEKLGLTATAIKKRMDRLIETGVIEEFSIILKPAMMESDYLIALVFTDGSEDEEEFIEHIGSHLMVVQVGQLATGVGRLYFIHCEYVGAEGLQNLGTFLRTLDSVSSIELHTTMTQRGEKFDIKKMHLRVLKQLLEDARMQVSEISERSGLTSRRVSRAIQEMSDSNAFWFATRWNLSLGKNTEFYLKIQYDEQASRMDEIDEWLRDRFPSEYWFSFYSAMEPVMFAKFVTEHFRDAEQISRIIKNAVFSKTIDVLLSYPVTKFPRLGRIRIEEMIRDAKL